MDYNALLELVKKRRSHRKFKPDPIPDEYVDKIIEVARWAPSGFNQQPWEFVVVKNPELKNKIVEFCNEYGSMGPKMEITRGPGQGEWKPEPGGGESGYRVAPVFILLLGDTRTIEGLPMMVRYDGSRQLSVFTSSLASAFLYMHLAAASLGLASQWLSAVSSPYPHCMIKNLLGIKEQMNIYDLMVLGYPVFQPKQKLLRDKAKMVHFDYCGEGAFRTDAEVKDFIAKARKWNIASEARKAK